MAKRYIGQSFDAIGGGDGPSVEISLVGSHLQNICIEVEGGTLEMSFILSPVGARKLVAGLEVALAELKKTA